MTIVCCPFCWVHVIIGQFFPCFFQTRRSCVRTDIVIFQIIQPFLKRGRCHLVKLVYPDQEILREDFRWQTLNQSIPFFHGHVQVVTRVHSRKRILSVIQIIIPFSNIKIKDTNRIYLLHFRIKFPQLYVFRDRFGYTIKYTF